MGWTRCGVCGRFVEGCSCRKSLPIALIQIEIKIKFMLSMNKV